mmetsp:Transcript_26167/g.52939  ORF Transcript_26167/g.52939 Transcript_26167/m.52939 type:complete len:95 (-) Transcript_26167:72-356(-)
MAAAESPATEPAERSSGGGSMRTTQSIIAGKSGRKSRTDARGNVIEKGNKGHRCTFVDEVDNAKPVEEKIEVTAYKGPQLTAYDDQPGCSCTAM